MNKKFNTDDYRWMHQYFSRMLNDVMLEHGITAAELSRRSSVGKSTLSAILTDEQPKLPNLVTLYKICRVLQIAPSYLLDFLSEWRPEKSDAHRMQSAFLAPAEFHHSEFFKKLMYDISSGEVVYLPTSIPEFMKSVEIMELEEADQTNIFDYVSEINSMDPRDMQGLIVHDSEILKKFFSGSGIYQKIDLQTRRALRGQLLDLSQYESWRESSFVVDFRLCGYSPLLLTKTNLAASYINGGYLLVQNETYANRIRSKIYSQIQSREQITSLRDFLERIEF
jgi:transcriptional regulator with XRE-family HTH domain